MNIFNDFNIELNPDNYLIEILGERYLGKNHWELGRLKKLYYDIKPLMPRKITRVLRKWLGKNVTKELVTRWPIEDRYVAFQKQVLIKALESINKEQMEFIHFWPGQNQFAFVLTHDIETSEGFQNARHIAEIEQSYGFRSSFNIIPERYEIDAKIIDWLRETGFEIGIHGLKHDGKLFRNYETFKKRAKKINEYIDQYSAAGFRTPLMHRNPYWLQMIDAKYDLSFFDTDPYEAIPGGTMSIWPYMMGRLIELPYTLVQDYTIFNVLGEESIDKWMNKIDFIRKNWGMALVNVHPDYMRNVRYLSLYEEFLKKMRTINGYWHALPGEVAIWWRKRMDADVKNISDGLVIKHLIVDNNDLKVK